MQKSSYTVEKLIPREERIAIRVDEAMERYQLSRSSLMREAKKRGALEYFGKSPRIIVAKMIQ